MLYLSIIVILVSIETILIFLTLCTKYYVQEYVSIHNFVKSKTSQKISMDVKRLSNLYPVAQSENWTILSK